LKDTATCDDHAIVRYCQRKPGKKSLELGSRTKKGVRKQKEKRLSKKRLGLPAGGVSRKGKNASSTTTTSPLYQKKRAQKKRKVLTGTEANWTRPRQKVLRRRRVPW